MSAAAVAARPTAAKSARPKIEVPDAKPLDLEGPVYVWNATGDPANDRPFTQMVVPFGFLKRMIYVREYDYEKAGGWQRKISKKHVADLLADIKVDTFSPTTWEVGIEDWHAKRLAYTEPDRAGGLRRVKVTVTNDRKLTLLDGGHRRQALLLYHAQTMADGDKALLARIDALPIPIKLSLSPKHLMQDFINYQRGKAVSRNLIKSMAVATGDYSEERLPIVQHATDAIRLLFKDSRSHLGGFVTFDEASGNKVQYASLVADNASSLATTIYGGSLIAMHYGKSPEWLAERYVEAYRAIEERGEPSEEGNENSIRRILTPGMVLSPTSKGGTRYGSHMLCGIFNCFAFRMAAIEMEESIDNELQRLVEEASRVFDRELEGTSAEDKRRDMNRFAKGYFSDMFRKEFPLKRADGTLFEKVDGLPVDLIELLSPSTLAVDKVRWKGYKLQKEGVPTPAKRTAGRSKSAEKTEEESQ